MQASLVSRQLIFREIFMSVEGMVLYVIMVIDLGSSGSRMKTVSEAA